MRKVRPLMWKTGYEGSIKGFFFKERSRKVKGYIDMDSAYKVGDIEFIGFFENNKIITDAYGGGAACQLLSSLGIEELMKLWVFVTEDRYKLFVKH